MLKDSQTQQISVWKSLLNQQCSCISTYISPDFLHLLLLISLVFLVGCLHVCCFVARKTINPILTIPATPFQSFILRHRNHGVQMPTASTWLLVS